MSIFSLLLLLLFGIPAALVLLSYAFAWYEAANRDPGLLERRFTPASLGLALRLGATETLCLVAAMLAHPLGWLPRRGGAPPPGEIPVLLLHGLFHNRGCWAWTVLRLRRAGWTSLHTLNLPPWKDLETLTGKVARRVEELRRAAGVERVHLVGHSMGGIIARNYLQLHDGAGRVERCVLLGTPNEGSRLVPFAISPLALHVMPGSELLQRLNRAPLPEGTRCISLATRHENIVLPPENARWDGAENRELSGLGHASLLFHPHALAALRTALTEETHDHARSVQQPAG